MDNKVKAIIGVAILAVGVIGFNAVSKELKKDPVVTGIEAEFVGEVAPGETFTKRMFSVQGVTDSGRLVKLNNFSSETEAAAMNGSTCEVEINSQGYTDTVIVNITREPVMEKNIGYPKRTQRLHAIQMETLSLLEKEISRTLIMVSRRGMTMNILMYI